jgi:hypothetical protein
MSDSFLDRALNLIASAQTAREDTREDVMRSILPEVLQPEELKEAESKPMKEEGPKTLHAPKYDRRMKFNTALERSEHEASREEPAWLKEAVEGVLPVEEEPNYRGQNAASLGTFLGTLGLGMGLTNPYANIAGAPASAKSRVLSPILLALLGGGIGALGGSLKKDEPIRVRGEGKEMGVGRAALMGMTSGLASGAAIRHMDSTGQVSDFLRGPLGGLVGGGAGLLSSQAYDALQNKEAGDAVFDFDGVTGRESTITTEEELERTPPLPIEEPEWYDVPNKPVMQKGAGLLQKQAVTRRTPEEEAYSQNKILALLGLSAGTSLSGKALNKGSLAYLKSPGGAGYSHLPRTNGPEAKADLQAFAKEKKKLWAEAQAQGWGPETAGKPTWQSSKGPALEAFYSPPVKDDGGLFSKLREKFLGKAERGPLISESRFGRPEIFAHEIGHSRQSRLGHKILDKTQYLSNKARLGGIPLTTILGATSYGMSDADADKSKLQDALVYGSGAGALALGAPQVANEVGASIRGARLMRAAGLNPRLRTLFTPNLSYLGKNMAVHGLPVALAAKLLYDRRQQSKPE